jgi:hypothetical protein
VRTKKHLINRNCQPQHTESGTRGDQCKKSQHVLVTQSRSCKKTLENEGMRKTPMEDEKVDGDGDLTNHDGRYPFKVNQ